ncbi:hypothetical protein EWM64_g596 [Hericium alpestre]|uniref:G domain-containing protein n=1 Tax=Hericium alpestre TaxID=135208 RepID=A0A4Z0ABM2_9AGAM|nr:hypothetical protein EWM64_g596 [Hericium alpestre]
MGATGSGKTTFINNASGSQLRVGFGLQSCTSDVQMAQAFQLDGRKVVLIDTPGFDDTSRTDTDILRLIASWLQVTYEKGMKLTGIIYMHRIMDNRVGGISKRNFTMFRELCGESTLRNVAIVTNFWGDVALHLGEAREAELRGTDIFFKPVLDKGACMVRHSNTVNSAHDILRLLINNDPMALRIQHELVDQHLDIAETAAGAMLSRELLDQARKHQEQLLQLQAEMEEAIRKKDEETRNELAEESGKLQTEMQKIQTDSQQLAEEHEAEKVETERRMREMQDKMREEAEQQKEAYRARIDELEKQMQDAVAQSAEEKEKMQADLHELQTQRDAIEAQCPDCVIA